MSDEQKADIYVPIDTSKLQEIIPPGEDILCSALCKGQNSFANKIITWNTHVLLTNKGVALHENYGKDLVPKYYPWHEVFSVGKVMKMTGISIGPNIRALTSYLLLRFKDTESNDEFNARGNAFVTRFMPIMTQSKEEWLAANRNNPDIKPKKLRNFEKELDMNNKAMEKWFKKHGKK
ncbi:MAG: hypothetical protein ACFFCS_05370 [Candidatus Hodarchaeota archaeon]